MRPFCLRAREIEGSGTEGAIVAYYCAPPRRAAPRSARTQRRVIAGRCYGMQKAMAKGGLSKEDKMELLPIMDELEAVRPRSSPACRRGQSVARRSWLLTRARPSLQAKSAVREMGIENGKQGAAAVARFAKNVFSNADLEDRSGTANEQTLRAFMAATV